MHGTKKIGFKRGLDYAVLRSHRYSVYNNFIYIVSQFKASPHLMLEGQLIGYLWWFVTTFLISMYYQCNVNEALEN